MMETPTNTFKAEYCFLKASANSQTWCVSDISTMWMYTSWNNQISISLSLSLTHRSWVLSPQHSLCSHTPWRCPPWPLLLYLCSYTPCGLSHLQTKHSTLFSINIKCLAESITITFLGYSHGCRLANPTVGSGDHKRPSHDGHIQVLGLEVFKCCLISPPKGTWKNTLIITNVQCFSLSAF